jgi:hypothetical protein
MSDGSRGGMPTFHVLENVAGGRRCSEGTLMLSVWSSTLASGVASG